MSNPDPRGDRPSSDGPPPRRNANPLIWILLLIALIAFGWYFYNQRGAVAPPVESPTPTPVAIGSAQEAAAERERAASDDRDLAGEPPPTPAAPP